jgi:diguanylate cyclase
VVAGSASAELFDRIGAFLAAHHLSPDPAHYAFAHRVLSDTSGPLAQAVESLTDGGVRLSARDIESLGGRIGALGLITGGAPDQPANDPIADARAKADGLVAQTQMQVDGFTDMVEAMRAETEHFGRDLAASADAILTAPETIAIEGIARLTGTMLERVRSAEERLEAATHEASELREKLEEARDNARRDPLTDLPNRRAFEEAYAAHAETAAPLCVAMVDVDHFKDVNDRFGHAVGDRVLKAIGEALVQGCPGHFVARYGGEEFAILFADADFATAAAALDATRQAVAAKRYRLRETDAPLGEVTFSAGIAQGGPGSSLGMVLGRADALLYRAKDEGRNCIRAD